VSAVLAHELTHTKSPVRRPRFLLGGMSGLLDDDERQALAAGRERLSGALGQGTSALSSLGQSASSAMSQAAGAGAGIVDSLPVGGGGLGAVSEVATRVARAAVLEASGSPMGNAFSGISGLPDMAGNAVSGLQSAAGDAMSGLRGAATDAVEGAASAVSDAAGGVSNVVGGPASGGAAGAGKPLDPDQVVEIVERRLLREIERRGGRWAGIF
jgi:hypothetical protein